MAVSTRIIRRRIKSIGNTKKITKAMELVSASKMRRAVNAVLGTRPYATLGWETVAELAKVTETGLHPLLRQPEAVRRVLTIFVTSDRGLCGGFNAAIVNKAVDSAKKHDLVFVGANFDNSEKFEKAVKYLLDYEGNFKTKLGVTSAPESKISFAFFISSSFCISGSRSICSRYLPVSK